jgi:hypothetical protein
VVAFVQNVCKAWYNFGAGLYLSPCWCMLHTKSKTPKARHQWRILDYQATDAVTERDLANIFAFATKNTEDSLLMYRMIVTVQDHEKNFALYILL